MAAASTVTTTVQVTGSATVPLETLSYSDANASSPGQFEYVNLTNSPLTLTIPAGTGQIIISTLGATAGGSATTITIGGTGVALTNMFHAPCGTPSSGPITAGAVIKLPVPASSPVLLLAADNAAHDGTATLSGVAIWFV